MAAVPAEAGSVRLRGSQTCQSGTFYGSDSLTRSWYCQLAGRSTLHRADLAILASACLKMTHRRFRGPLRLLSGRRHISYTAAAFSAPVACPSAPTKMAFGYSLRTRAKRP